MSGRVKFKDFSRAFKDFSRAFKDMHVPENSRTTKGLQPR
jgi:hypothetical protein